LEKSKIDVTAIFAQAPSGGVNLPISAPDRHEVCTQDVNDDESHEVQDIDHLKRDGSLLQKLFQKSKETHYLRDINSELRDERKRLLRKLELSRHRANTAEIQRMNLGELVENLTDENNELHYHLDILEEENLNYQMRVDLLEKHSRSYYQNSICHSIHSSFYDGDDECSNDDLGEISISERNTTPKERRHRRVFTYDGTASLSGESEHLRQIHHKRIQSKSSVRFDPRIMDHDVTRWDINPALQNKNSGKRFVDVIIPDLSNRNLRHDGETSDSDSYSDDADLPFGDVAFSGSNVIGDVIFGEKRTQCLLQSLHQYNSQLLNLFVVGICVQILCNFYVDLFTTVYFFPIITFSLPLMALIWTSMNIRILFILLSNFQVLFIIFVYTVMHGLFLVYTPHSHTLATASTVLHIVTFLPFCGLTDSLPTVLRSQFSLKLHSFYIFYVLSLGIDSWSSLGVYSFQTDSTESIIFSTLFSSTLIIYAIMMSYVAFEVWNNPDVFIFIRGRYFHSYQFCDEDGI